MGQSTVPVLDCPALSWNHRLSNQETWPKWDADHGCISPKTGQKLK